MGNAEKKKLINFLGVYICFFMFIGCAATGFQMGVIFFKILGILFWGLFLFTENESRSVTLEKYIITLFVLLFNALILLRGKTQGQHETINILCCCTLVVMSIMFLAQEYNGIHIKDIKEWIVKNKTILLFILCFIILSIEVIDSWAMWDAWQYYARGNTNIQEAVIRFDSNFSGIYDLYLVSHAALGYFLWVILFQLFREGTELVHIADIVLACISIFSYYQILRKMLGKKFSDSILALASVPYAFSPFVLGIIGNINIDSATMYFSVIFLACVLYHYEYLELIVAFLLCFTKETAVIYYVIYIITKIVCQYLLEYRFHLWGLIKYGLSNIKNYLYALPAVLWLFLYKIDPNGGWSGEAASAWNNKGWNCFGISNSVVLMKLKQIFFLNFNWIFWATIVLGVIALCRKKAKVEKEVRTALIPITAMGGAVIVVGCVYITFILPRYIVPVIPILYLMATMAIGNFKSKNFTIYNVVISILLLAQCFKVVDPIMANIFPSVVVGENQVMYEVGNEMRFDDHTVYNRQNIYWSETIIKVLEKAGYNGDMLIVLPEAKKNMQYDIFGNFKCLWNTQTRKLEYYVESKGVPKGCTWLKTAYPADVIETLNQMDNNYILYIIPKWREINKDFVSDKKIIEQGEVSNRGFDVQYMVMEVEYNLPLESGQYTVSPKQEDTLCIGTDGANLLLQSEVMPISFSAMKTKYNLIFDEYQVAVDVKHNKVDDKGTVWAWKINQSNAQQWLIEEIDGYYMICWNEYALTYDLNNSSVKLTPKTGEDSQLWSITQ